MGDSAFQVTTCRTRPGGVHSSASVLRRQALVLIAALLLSRGVAAEPGELVVIVHPSNAAQCRDERGQIAPGRTIPLLPAVCRVVGHDGATTDRYPGVTAGHMKGDA